MRFGRGSLALVLAALLATACSDDDESSAHAFCSGVCKAVSRCGRQALTGSCLESCTSSASSFERVSHAGAEHLGACISNADCVVFEDESAWDASYEACWQKAKGGISVTEQARAVCARYVAAWFECGAQTSTRECEANLGMWSSAVSEQLDGCADRATCAELDACTSEVFEK